MSEKTHILDLSGDELREQFAAMGMPAYRAAQVRQWIFDKRLDSFDEMTNLSKADRTKLADRFVIASGTVAAHQVASDGVHKLLLRWRDGMTSEAVMIPAERRRTACISSQVGCPVGCRFCASGMMGLERNLTAGQIVEQAWQLTRQTMGENDRLSNVVFMGLGEPLANFANVLKSIRLLNADDGLNVGQRKMSVSTIGLPAQIRKLAEEELQVTLALSLHAPTQELRGQLIPWASKIPLEEVLSAVRYYFDRTGREITIEYTLLESINSTVEQADKLADICHTIRCSVNLIYYNPVAGLGYDRPMTGTVHAFRDRLKKRGVNVHIRQSRGLDIDAACGQLRRRAQEQQAGS